MKKMAGMSNISANTNSMPDCTRWNENKAASFFLVTLETEPTTASHTQTSSLAVYHELYSHPKHKTETIQEYEKNLILLLCMYVYLHELTLASTEARGQQILWHGSYRLL